MSFLGHITLNEQALGCRLEGNESVYEHSEPRK